MTLSWCELSDVSVARSYVAIVASIALAASHVISSSSSSSSPPPPPPAAAAATA